MKFINGLNAEGGRELIALDKVVSIKKHGDYIKVLCGGGLYWHLMPNTVEITDFSDKELEGVFNHEQ